MGLLDKLIGKKQCQVSTQLPEVGFTVERGQSVLEAALAQGIAFPHSCTVGTCGSCKCRLVSGQIREISNFGYVLSAEELRGNIILACQASPKSDIELDVPDLQDRHLQPVSKFRARIVAMEALTHDIRRVRLKLDRPIRFDAGQYAHLSVDAVHGARAYSFALAPQPDGCEEIELIIRHVPGGAFTDLLFGDELDGADIEVQAPFGSFLLRPSRAPMVCISGGSGLGPILSILEDAAANDCGRPCIVLFGARSQADLYEVDRIEAVGRQWNGPFRFVPVLSEEAPDSDWEGARGLVTEHIAEAAQGYLSADTEAYLCGPPAMIDHAMPVLTGLGLNESDIHFDRFLDGSHGLNRQG